MGAPDSIDQDIAAILGLSDRRFSASHAVTRSRLLAWASFSAVLCVGVVLPGALLKSTVNDSALLDAAQTRSNGPFMADVQLAERPPSLKPPLESGSTRRKARVTLAGELRMPLWRRRHGARAAPSNMQIASNARTYERFSDQPRSINKIQRVPTGRADRTARLEAIDAIRLLRQQ